MDSVAADESTLPLNFDTSLNFTSVPSLTAGANEEMPNRHLVASPPVNSDEASGATSSSDATTDATTDATPPPEANCLFTFSHNYYLPSLDASRLSLDDENDNHKMTPRSKNIKDYGQQISELKKENFSLKLRIYHMEERMGQHYSTDLTDLNKENIELKVKCSSLESDIQDLNKLLKKAKEALDGMKLAPEQLEEAKKRNVQLEQENQALDGKLQQFEQKWWEMEQTNKKKQAELEKEVKTMQDRIEVLAEENARLKEDHSPDLEELRAQLREYEEDLEEKDGTIARLTECLSSKQTVIELLNEEKSASNPTNASLHNQNDNLRRQLEEKELEAKEAKAMEAQAQQRYVEVVILHEEYQDHITEQQQRLDDFEKATKQMTTELDRRETELKEVKKKLEEHREDLDAREERLENMKGENEESEKQLKREVVKRDRLVVSLNKMIKAKEEEMEKVQNDLKEWEQKAEELTDALHKSEMEKPLFAGKEKTIAQLKEQLDQASDNLQEARKDAKVARDECELKEREMERSEREWDDKEASLKREVMKRDKTIASMSKMMGGKDEEIEKLTSELKENEKKAEELARLIHKHEMQKPQTAGKEKLINQLREQLSEANEALQDVYDKKSKSEESYERSLRDARSQLRHAERQSDRNKSQMDDNEETILKLESLMKEKDEDLEKALNSIKQLNRDQKVKEEERDRAVRERHLMAEQVAIEKGRFGELADKLLNLQQPSDNSNEEQMSVGAIQRMWQLEDKLRTGEQEIHERCRERDRALMEVQQLKRDLDRLEQDKDDDLRSKCDEMNVKNNKIVTLTSSLEKSNILRRQAEEKLLSETEEFKRLNNDLYDKLASCKSQLDKLKNDKTRRTCLNLEGTSDNHQDASNQLFLPLSPSDSSDSLQNCKSFVTLSYWSDEDVEIRQLYDELEAKDKEINRLHELQTRPVYILEEEFSDATVDYEGELVALTTKPRSTNMDVHPHEGAVQSGDQITYSYNVINQSQTQSQMQGAGERLQLMSSSSVNENKHVRMHEDIKQVQSSVDEINRTLTTRNETVNTTFGNVLDQTSYLQIQPQLHLSTDDGDLLDLGVNELRKALRDTKLQLKGTIEDYSLLSESSNQQVRDIQELKDKLNRVSHENEKLASEQRQATDHRVIKQQEEIESLLRRLRELEIMTSQQQRTSSPSSPRHRHEPTSSSSSSCNEDLNSLKRDELKELVGNLKRELKSCEKLLLMRKSGDDVSEKTKLREELDQVKGELHEARMRLLDASSRGLESRGLESRGMESGELERALSMNGKLRERLAATEQTVRRQSERVRRMSPQPGDSGRVRRMSPQPGERMRRATSSPLRNMRSFASVPDLDKVYSSDAATQTSSHDSGIASSQSISSLNAVIHQQSKELSQLRSKLSSARSAYKQLNSQMDVLANYVNSLVTSGGEAYTAGDVRREVARSRNIVRKVRRALDFDSAPSGHMTASELACDHDVTSDDELSMSSVTSEVMSPSLARIHNRQIGRLTDALARRDQLIRHLESRASCDVIKLTRGGRHNSSLPSATSQPRHRARDSSKGLVGKLNLTVRSHHGNHGNGFLTPSSSLNSLLTDEEISAALDLPSSRNHANRAAPYPSVNSHHHVSDNSPQPTFNYRGGWSGRRGNDLRKHNSELQLDHLGCREEEDEEVKFSAEFNGAWSKRPVDDVVADDVSSPTRQRRARHHSSSTTLSHHRRHPCMTSRTRHEQERELERMRRRMGEIRKLNKILKEELSKTNDKLLLARDKFEKDRMSHRNHHYHHHNATSGFDALLSHLDEIRALRQRLEKSIDSNELLRQKLEARILQGGDDEVGELSREREASCCGLAQSDEVEKVREQLDACVRQLEAAERDRSNYEHEMALLRKHNLTLKETLQRVQQELDQQNKVSKSLVSVGETRQYEVDELKLKLDKLQQEKMIACSEAIEAQQLASQFERASKEARMKLRETQLQLRAKTASHVTYDQHQQLLDEIRNLRVQLEVSITTNAALRRQLEARVMREGELPKADSSSKMKEARRKLVLDTSVKNRSKDEVSSLLMTPPDTASTFHPHIFEDEPLAKLPNYPNNLLYNAHGPYRVCRSEKLEKLESLMSAAHEWTRQLDHDVTHHVYELGASDMTSLIELITCVSGKLEESREVVRKEFWPASVIPSTNQMASCQPLSSNHNKPNLLDESLPQDTEALRMEVVKLRGKLTKRDRLLKDTVDNLVKQNRMKNELDHVIARHLQSACGNLTITKGNLERKLARNRSGSVDKLVQKSKTSSK